MKGEEGALPDHLHDHVHDSCPSAHDEGGWVNVEEEALHDHVNDSGSSVEDQWVEVEQQGVVPFLDEVAVSSSNESEFESDREQQQSDEEEYHGNPVTSGRGDGQPQQSDEEVTAVLSQGEQQSDEEVTAVLSQGEQQSDEEVTTVLSQGEQQSDEEVGPLWGEQQSDRTPVVAVSGIGVAPSSGDEVEFESDREQQSDEEGYGSPPRRGVRQSDEEEVAEYGIGMAYVYPNYGAIYWDNLTMKVRAKLWFPRTESPNYPRGIILSKDITVRAAKEIFCELGYARDVSTLKLWSASSGRIVFGSLGREYPMDDILGPLPNENDSRELADEEPLFGVGPLPHGSGSRFHKVQQINMKVKSPVTLLLPQIYDTITNEDELIEIIGELARKTTPGDGSVLQTLLALLDTSAKHALAAALRKRARGPTLRVREAAAKAVGQIAERGRGSVAEGAVRVLVNRLRMDPDKGVRRACVVSLQQVVRPGDATAIAALLQRLEGDEDHVDVRFVVSKALLALVSPGTRLSARIVSRLKQRLGVVRDVHARFVMIWCLHHGLDARARAHAQFDATAEIRKVYWCGLGMVFFYLYVCVGIWHRRNCFKMRYGYIIWIHWISVNTSGIFDALLCGHDIINGCHTVFYHRIGFHPSSNQSLN